MNRQTLLHQLERLHLGAPNPQAGATTFCGRPIADVTYWATTDVAEHMTFAERCSTCERSRARRQREFGADIASWARRNA